jgi:hypothetical protein
MENEEEEEEEEEEEVVEKEAQVNWFGKEMDEASDGGFSV